MSSHSQPRVMTFKAGSTGIVKGCVVKAGADGKHVLIAAAATDKSIGLSLNVATAAEDKVEVALPGGGAKGLLGGTVAFGDYLASDGNGALVVTTSANDKVMAQAMEAGVVGDLIAVEVMSFNY